MMNRASCLAILLILHCGIASATEVRCDYSDRTIVKTVGTIDGIRNFSSKVANYAEEKRICAVKFDAKVGKKWYKTKNFYVFGPDMSQTEACNKAKDKAKITVLEQHAPQLVTSNVEHVCTEKTPERVVEVIKPVQTKQVSTTKWVSGTDLETLPPKYGNHNPNRKRHDNFNDQMRIYNFVTMLLGQF